MGIQHWMERLSAAERSLRARMAAHTLHAKQDSKAIAARARQGKRKAYERKVDPDGVLPPEERARRAEHAEKADMAKAQLAAAQKRREDRLSKAYEEKQKTRRSARRGKA